MRIRLYGLGVRFVSVVQVLLLIVVCVPFNVWSGVGVWTRFYGQGLRLSLCGSGARMFLARRWYSDTAHGQGFACLSVVLVLVRCVVVWW